MYKGKRIGVVVPAYNEERLIQRTLTTLPAYVDRVIVVEDCSTDATFQKVEEVRATDSRVECIRHETNQGVGAAVVSGYRRLLESTPEKQVDVVAVMAGDAQMNPDYLCCLLDKVICEGYVMAKGNRFLGHPDALRKMPKYRVFGNVVLTILTKFASGYWSIFDTQNGYVAVRTEALRRIDLGQIARRYDLENSFLIQLNIIGARVTDVPIPAVYGDEVSSIRLWRVVPRMVVTLATGFLKRIYYRYVLVNFHPVALFLMSGALLTLWGVGFGLWTAVESLGPDAASTGTVMLSVLPLMLGFQLLLAGLVLDMINEPR